MKSTIIFIIIICLLVGAFVGVLVGYYQPKIRGYEGQVSYLTTQVTNLEQTVLNFSNTISSQQTQISNQEAQISTLENEISNQRAQITAHEVQISTLKSEKASIQIKLSEAEAETKDIKKELYDKNRELLDLKSRLDDILDITVTQNYQWAYGGRTWNWDLPISIEEYIEFSERPRPLFAVRYVRMATDPKDDYYIDSMVEEINKAASEKRYNDVQTLNFVVSFVQNLPYTLDEETTPYDEYPRYPLETLFDRGGDCEDTSILAAALLDRMGYDVVLLHLKNAQHVAIGVSLPSAYGTYYEYAGEKYFYLETTGEGWGVGDFPPDIKDSTAYIYPLRG